jgi:hypothetical protein
MLVLAAFALMKEAVRFMQKEPFVEKVIRPVTHQGGR